MKKFGRVIERVHFLLGGGNKEVLNGVNEILLENGQLMRDFALAGWEVLKDYFLIRFVPKSFTIATKNPNFKRTHFLCAKLEEDMMLLHLTAIIFPAFGMIGVSNSI